jgi:hypothetical protein
VGERFGRSCCVEASIGADESSARPTDWRYLADPREVGHAGEARILTRRATRWQGTPVVHAGSGSTRSARAKGA